MCAAPARVTALQADNGHTTHSLTVSWERPVGVFDSYILHLLDEAGVCLINQSIAAETRSKQLEGLTSGKWYRVKVVTLSGGVPSLNAAVAEGQTRKSPLHLERRCSWFLCNSGVCPPGPAAVSNLTVTAVNTSSLSFSWRPSAGHVDLYDLSLFRESESMDTKSPADGRKEHQQVGRRS